MTDRAGAQNPAVAVLAEAAVAVGRAPSVHNTQPWRWRVWPGALDLFADRDRGLARADADGRLMLVSCGAALHHARMALAAGGWAVEVDRFPEAADTDHLARLTLAGRAGVGTAARHLLRATEMRHTDRRPVIDEPVDPSTLDAVGAAVRAEGARLHVLRPDDVVELASAAARAQEAELADPDWRAELEYWAGAAPLGDGPHRPAGTGVPDEAIPSEPPQTTVPGRDFGRAGTLPAGAGHDGAAVYAILYGDEDSPAGWLRAGEALSAGWLTATTLGVSVVPLSAVVEVSGTYHTLRRLLSGVGYPCLVLRLGIADPTHRGPAATPRLAADQIVEIAEEA